jgi:hypothetical protein
MVVLMRWMSNFDYDWVPKGGSTFTYVSHSAKGRVVTSNPKTRGASVASDFSQEAFLSALTSCPSRPSCRVVSNVPLAIHSLPLRITTTAAAGIPEAPAELTFRKGPTERVVLSEKADADDHIKLQFCDDAPAHPRLSRRASGRKHVGPECVCLPKVRPCPTERISDAPKLRALGPLAHPIPPFPASITHPRRLGAPCTSTL